MKVYIVFAHPDLRSYNGSILKGTVEHLTSKGQEVRVADLYRQHFKAVVDEDDFLNHEKGTRLDVCGASARAKLEGKLTPDVIEAQEDMEWADLVIFQFPMWWYSMPAIMKGWIDRVFSAKWAYNIGPKNSTHWDDIFGEGKMEGKKAIILTTCGDRQTPFSARGINGPIDDVLFPITHGMLFYVGFSVLPSQVIYDISKCNEASYRESLNKWLNVLDNVNNTEPIPFRKQNFGDYSLPSTELKEGLEKPGEYGFSLHIAK